MPLSCNTCGVHARNNSLEALWPPLAMSVKLLAKIVVGNIRWKEQEPCSPSQCLQLDLQGTFDTFRNMQAGFGIICMETF